MYKRQAQAQGVANLESARATAKLNNPNIINPYGTQTVTYGGEPTFDAQGYDKAYKQYEADLASYNANPYVGNSFGGNSIGRGYLGGIGIQQQAKPRPIAPDKNSFWMGTGDQMCIRDRQMADLQKKFANQEALINNQNEKIETMTRKLAMYESETQPNVVGIDSATISISDVLDDDEPEVLVSRGKKG